MSIHPGLIVFFLFIGFINLVVVIGIIETLKRTKNIRKTQVLMDKLNKSRSSSVIGQKNKEIDFFYFSFFIFANMPYLNLIQSFDNIYKRFEWNLLFLLISYSFFHSYLGKRLLKKMKIDIIISIENYSTSLYENLVKKEKNVKSFVSTEILSIIIGLIYIDSAVLLLFLTPASSFRDFLFEILGGTSILSIFLFAILTMVIYLMIYSTSFKINKLLEKIHINRVSVKLFISNILSALISNIIIIFMIVLFFTD